MRTRSCILRFAADSFRSFRQRVDRRWTDVLFLFGSDGQLTCSSSGPPSGQMSDSADCSERRCFDCVLDSRRVQAVVCRLAPRFPASGTLHQPGRSRSGLSTNIFPTEPLISRGERTREWSYCSFMEVSGHLTALTRFAGSFRNKRMNFQCGNKRNWRRRTH